MKKISRTVKDQSKYALRPYALINHDHPEYVPVDAVGYVVTITSDVNFLGKVSGFTAVLTVADNAERDAIVASNRYEGMLLYVQDIGVTYQLQGGITNTDWIDLSGTSGTWGSIAGTLTDQTDLVAALAGKSANGHTHPIAGISSLQTALDSKAAFVHTHPQSGITDLVSDLAAKAALSHGHATSEITGLDTELSTKAALSHNHVIAEITNLTTFTSILSGLVPASGGGTTKYLRADGTWQVVTGGGGGSSWGTITGTLADQLDLQTALDTKHGTAIFTDLANGLTPSSGGGTTKYLRADGTWVIPPDTVTDVSAVWGNVSGTLLNQTDLQSALDAKSAVGHGHTTAAISGLDAALASFADAAHTHFTSEVTGLDTALAGKAASVHTHVIGDTTGLQAALDGKHGTTVFTSIANGLTPLSGGGTTKYLRADGTWVIPPDTNTDTLAVWGSITGTLSGQTDLQNALNAKASTSVFTDVANGLAPLSGGGTANFLRADGTWVAPPTGGSPAWGSITGTLSAQTDLQSALDAKAGTTVMTAVANGLAPLSGGGTTNYLRADGTWDFPPGNAGSPILEKSLTQPGDVVVLTGNSRWYPPAPVTLIEFQASVGTAPTGANLIVDVNVDGTSQANDGFPIVAGAFKSAIVGAGAATGVVLYNTQITTAAPVAYWRLGEASGAQAIDEISTNHGTYSGTIVYGAPSLQAGDLDTAITFGGTSAKIAIPAGIIPTSTWTIECIIKPTLPGGWQGIIGNSSAGPSVYMNPTGYIQIYSSGATSTQLLLAGQTYHVIAQCDGVNTSIYIDGVLASPLGSVVTLNPVAIGANSSGGERFVGEIDEMALYNRILTPTEKTDHAEAVATGAFTSPSIDGGYVTVDVTQIGSTIPGSDLVVSILYRVD